jgi:hypothetical protein
MISLGNLILGKLMWQLSRCLNRKHAPATGLINLITEVFFALGRLEKISINIDIA